MIFLSSGDSKAQSSRFVDPVTVQLFFKEEGHLIRIFLTVNWIATDMAFERKFNGLLLTNNVLKRRINFSATKKTLQLFYQPIPFHTYYFDYFDYSRVTIKKQLIIRVLQAYNSFGFTDSWTVAGCNSTKNAPQRFTRWSLYTKFT